MLLNVNRPIVGCTGNPLEQTNSYSVFYRLLWLIMDLAEDIGEINCNGNIDNKIQKAYKESNVADFTISPEEFSENKQKIRLKSAIDIR